MNSSSARQEKKRNRRVNHIYRHVKNKNKNGMLGALEKILASPFASPSGVLHYV